VLPPHEALVIDLFHAVVSDNKMPSHDGAWIVEYEVASITMTEMAALLNHSSTNFCYSVSTALDSYSDIAV